MLSRLSLRPPIHKWPALEYTMADGDCAMDEQLTPSSSQRTGKGRRE